MKSQAYFTAIDHLTEDEISLLKKTEDMLEICNDKSMLEYYELVMVC